MDQEGWRRLMERRAGIEVQALRERVWIEENREEILQHERLMQELVGRRNEIDDLIKLGLLQGPAKGDVAETPAEAAPANEGAR